MGFMQEEIRYRKYERGFTLIELMATLVILALIIAIAVPAIGKLVAQADSSADKSSMALMERAGEMAYIDDLKTDDAAPKNSKLPASITEKDVYMIPTLIEKGYLNLDDASKFNKPENYVKKVNKSGDFVYMGKGSDGKPVDTPTELASCTRDGVYTVATHAESDFNWKTVQRNVSYDAMTMNKKGEYVAIGTFGDFYPYPRGGYALDKYNKDLKLIDTEIVEFNDTDKKSLYGNYTGYIIPGTADLIEAADGRYVAVNNGAVFVFDSDLELVKEVALSGAAEGMSVYRLLQQKSGSYLVAGQVDDQLSIVKLDANFATVDVLELAKGHYDGVSDFEMLQNGDVLLAASISETNGETGLYRVSEDLSSVTPRVLSTPANDSKMSIGSVAELSDGSIVVVEGRYADRYATDKNAQIIQVLDASLNPVHKKEFMTSDSGKSSYYQSDSIPLYVDGTTFTTVVHASEQVTFNADLTERSSEFIGHAPYGANRYESLRDGDSYVSYMKDGRDRDGISKTYRFGEVWSGDVIEVIEKAPRAIHTAPPLKENFADLVTGDTYTDDENLNQQPIVDTNGDGKDDRLSSDDAPTDKEPDEILDMLAGSVFYASNYSTDRVDSVFAGHFVYTGGIVASPESSFYQVASDGSLVASSMGALEKRMNEVMADVDMSQVTPETFGELGLPRLLHLSTDTKTLMEFPYMGMPFPALTGVTVVDSPLFGNDENTEDKADFVSDGKTMNPCYEGSFIVKVQDMQLYQVQADGTLALIGDPSVKTPDELGYDIWSDTLLYLYPNGSLLDFPAINEPYSQS